MGVRAGLAEDASSTPAAQAALPGEEAAAELARALAQIAQEDPDGAASLGASLGLQGAAPAAPSTVHTATARPGGFASPERFMGSLLLEPSEDFDVDVTLTVAVVGSRAVGKTALVRHFVRGTFSEDYQKSIATEFVERRTSLEAEEVTFHIWDCPGSDDPASYAQSGCRRAQAYVITFSTEDRASFEKVEDWVAAIRKAHGPEVLLILAQTKCDLVYASHAGACKEEVEALVHRMNLLLCISSAQDGVGTTETFERLGTELLARARRTEEEFRAGKAIGGLQWESAPQGGTAAGWSEAPREDAATPGAAAASSCGVARPVQALNNAQVMTAAEADAEDADEDVGLLLPGL